MCGVTQKHNQCHARLVQYGFHSLRSHVILARLWFKLYEMQSVADPPPDLVSHTSRLNSHESIVAFQCQTSINVVGILL